MNPAQEATLAELVKVATAMGKDIEKLRKLAEKTGGGSTGSTGGAGGLGTASANAANNINAMSTAAKAFNATVSAISFGSNILSGLLSGLSSIVGGLIGTVSKTAENFIKFAITTTTGEAKLSDFIRVFKDLPSIFGTFASLVADVAQYFESLLGTYREMTKSGVTFSGSLTDMRLTAAKAQMNLQEFSQMVKDNSEIMSSLGGGVERGMRKFVDIQSTLMGPNSKYAKELLGLGFTAQEVSESLGTYIRLQGNMNKEGLQNNRQIAEGVVGLNKELDLYAKATGVSRKQLEDDLKKKSFDASFKQFTQGLSPEKAAAATAAWSRAVQEGGEGAGDMVKQLFMTGGRFSTPITDAAKQFFIQTNGTGETYARNAYNIATNMKMGSEEALTAELQNRKMIGDSYQSFLKQFGDGAAILNITGNTLFRGEKLMETGIKTQTQSQAMQKILAAELIRQQKEQAVGSAASFALVEQGFKTFGNSLTGVVINFLAPLMPRFAELGAWISGILNDPKVTAGLTRITNWISNALDSLQEAFKEGGIGGLIREGITQMIDGLQNVWRVIKDPLIKGLTDFWDYLKPLMLEAWDNLVKFVQPKLESMFKSMLDKVNDWLAKAFPILGLESSEDRTKREGIEQTSQYKDFLKSTSKQRLTLTGFEDRSPRDLFEEYKDKMGSRYDVDQRGRMLVDPRRVDMNQEKRATGTWGMTGQLTEPTTTVAQIEAGETVLTPEQRNAMLNAMNGGAGNNLNDTLNRLNSMTAQMTYTLQEIAKYSKQNVDATKALNGNLLA